MHIPPTFTKPSHFSHSNNARVKVDKPRSRVTTEIQQKAALAAPDLPSKAAAQAAQPSDAIAQSAPHKPKRTLGLKIFDNLLYTFFMYPFVFATSVALTYMTFNGHSMGKEGSSIRGFTSFFANRRDGTMKFFEKLGASSVQAQKDFTTVLWSFVDGTIFALLAKPLEDRREKIAESIDNALGTAPADKTVYEAEPKQSWRSVAEGRGLTGLIVLPVAMLMERKEIGGNEKVFYAPGRKLADYIAQKVPKVEGALNKLTIHNKKEFFGVVLFETFYTAVCTLGLYIMSRSVARKHPKKDKNTVAHAAPAKALADQSTVREEATAAEQPDKPSANISQPTLLERVAQPQQTAELTA
jgi:hypothetical protein